MAKQTDMTRLGDLLEKLLVFQMHNMRMSQDRIAKAVGRKKAWVNNLLKGLPRGRRSDGERVKGKG